MAFVSQSERIEIYNGKTPETIGPGSYYQPLKKKKLNVFPFNSSQRTLNREKAEQLTQSPGPGHYSQNQSLELSFQDIINNNQSSFFKSSIPRMEFQKSQTPGPGTYNKFNSTSNSQQKRNSKQFTNQNRNMISSIPDIKNQKMIDLHLGNIENGQNKDYKVEIQKQRENRILNVYAKQNTRYQKKLNSYSDKLGHWSKLTGPQIEKVEKNTTQNELGPGYYQQTLKKSKVQSMSVFKSDTQRTFDQNKKNISQQFIINKFQSQLQLLSNDFKMKQPHDNMVQELMNNQFCSLPGPGQYFREQKQPKQKNEKFQFFGSSCKRAKEQKKVNLQIQNESLEKKPLKKENFNKEQRWQHKKKKETPGPGLYNPSNNFSKQSEKWILRQFWILIKKIVLNQIDKYQAWTWLLLTLNFYKQKSGQIRANIILQKFNQKRLKKTKHQQIKFKQSTEINNSIMLNLSKQSIQPLAKKPTKQIKQIPFLTSGQKIKQLEKQKVSQEDISKILNIQEQDKWNKDYLTKKRNRQNFDKQKRFKNQSKEQLGPGEYGSIIFKELNKKSFNVNFL